MKKKKEKLEKESVVGSFLKKIFRPVSDGIYDASVFIYNKLPKKQTTTTKKRVGEACFYWLGLAIPLLQFILMYVVVNVNSFVLAFQSYEYNIMTGEEVIEWIGFKNFQDFWTAFTSNPLMLGRIKNSFIVYAVHLFVGTVLAILFAYYVYKGFKGTEFFRVTLFMPSILSPVVLVMIYMQFVEKAIPVLFGVEGLLSSGLESTFWTVIFYNIFMGFGSGMLMYSNAMGRIPDSLTEYAQLEGCTPIKEFFYITLPLIYPTIETFLIIGLSNLFIDQANLFTFFMEGAQNSGMETIGYHLFQTVFTERSSMTSFPYAAAAGLTLTAITIPVVMTARYFLNKLDKGVEF